MIKPFFSHQRKKAKKRYPWIDEYVAEMMERQAVIEQDISSSVDISADPTAQMLGKSLQKTVMTKPRAEFYTNTDII